jgi:hypothetical protein
MAKILGFNVINLEEVDASLALKQWLGGRSQEGVQVGQQLRRAVPMITSGRTAPDPSGSLRSWPARSESSPSRGWSVGGSAPICVIQSINVDAPKRTSRVRSSPAEMGGSGLSGFGWTVEKPDIEAAAGRGGI